MTLTPSGVAYNLDESPYYYRWRDYEFRFSSVYHKRRFIEQLNVKREWLNDSLSNRFKMDIKADILAVLQLYRQVETRGYLVIDAMGREYRTSESFIIRIEQED